MDEEHVQARLISLLRQENIRLWLQPFTTDTREPHHQNIQDLADKYASVTGFTVDVVRSALEIIRSDAVMKGEGNKQFKETSLATLELHLPKGVGKKKKERLQTKLDITTRELKKLITEQYGVLHFKLISEAKTLSPDKRLDEQNVKNNSKVLVVIVRPEEVTNEMLEVEEKNRSQDEGLQRTQKGFQILSERDGSEDPATTPFLEIADQKGNPLQIPDEERKALILAMGFHEKGRALMKKRNYSSALCHMLEADEQFKKCDSSLLHTVDNYAVLQLDIVWCYRALEELPCLDDAKQRLEKAEKRFVRCYGEERSRLQLIKGHTGGEDVLFLRLYLLQCLLAFLEGKEKQAAEKIMKVEELYSQLVLDPEKMNQLMALGFSEQEARLGLRACRGNIEDAALHLTQRKQEKADMRKREREKRRRRIEAINTLVGLGYSKRQAAKALHQANGDVDRAYGILLDSPETERSDRQVKLDELVSLGFQLDMADSALRLVGDDLLQATQMLLDNQGMIPPDLLSPSPPSSSSEEPSTSSDSTASGSAHLDEELVNEVLEDIPRHEEDYLDLTLDEEKGLIDQMKSYLEKKPSTSS